MHRVKFPAYLAFVLICISLSASAASAQAVASSGPAATPVNATAITGVFNGTYRCARGPVNLRLTLVAPGDGSLSGVFTFDLPANSSPRTASYSLIGRYDAATGRFRLDPDKWEPPEPANYVMVGMDGAYNSSTEQVSGKITSLYATCTTFEATRNKAQSAALPHHPAVTPASPAARTAQQPPSSSTTGTTRPRVANSSPTPQSQDPRLTNLPPERRQLLLAEVVNSKDYCTNNEVLSALFDCTCFAKSALDYRIKHATFDESGIVSIMDKLDIRQCVLEDKVIKWATDTANSHGATKIADCIGRTMVQNLRTKPEMGDISRAGYSEAVTACSNTTGTARQSGPAQTQKQQGRWWYCSASHGPPNPVQYMTGVFFYPDDGMTTGTQPIIFAAWSKYIDSKHPNSENLSAGCQGSSPDKAAVQRFHDALSQMKEYEQIAVDWKYVQGQDTPTVASGPIGLYYCSGYLGTTPNTLYFSDSFEAPKQTDTNLVRDDFVRFIKEKYSPQSHEASGGCGSSDKAKEEGPMRAGGKTIIETGWKPTSLPQSHHVH